MEYIWITRWPDFQHYRPERDRPPAWIKDYTKQLDDDDYRELSLAERGLLADLRRTFARSHGKCRSNTLELSRRLGQQVLRKQLDALSHAGLIELVSRETLEQRLEQLYSSPRTRIEGEGEGDKETPKPPSTNTPEKPGRPVWVCPDCGTSFRGPLSLAEHRYHSHNGPEPTHWLEAETRTRA